MVRHARARALPRYLSLSLYLSVSLSLALSLSVSLLFSGFLGLMSLAPMFCTMEYAVQKGGTILSI